MIFLFSFSGVTDLSAQIKMSGSLQSWFYTYENQDDGQKFNFYQGFRFRVRDEGYKNLSFKTYFRAAYRGIPEDWEGRAYNMYLDWYTLKGKLNLRAGRQFLYSGVINGVVDGLLADFRDEILRIKVIVGNAAPYDLDFQFQDAGAIGTSVEVRPSQALNFNLSYYQKYRQQTEIWRQLGFSIGGRLPDSFQYSARVFQNLLTSEYQSMRFRLTYFYDLWSITAEYNKQKPQIYEDSFFSRFQIFAFTQIRSQITYKLGNHELGLQNLYTTYKNSETDNQLIFTLSGNWGFAGILYQDGYGGQNIGAYGDVRYDFTEKLTGRLFASVYNYQRYTVDITEDAVAYSVGLHYKLMQGMLIRAEAQQSVNSYFKNSWRGLLILNWAFN